MSASDHLVIQAGRLTEQWLGLAERRDLASEAWSRVTKLGERRTLAFSNPPGADKAERAAVLFRFYPHSDTYEPFKPVIACEEALERGVGLPYTFEEEFTALEALGTHLKTCLEGVKAEDRGEEAKLAAMKAQLEVWQQDLAALKEREATAHAQGLFALFRYLPEEVDFLCVEEDAALKENATSYTDTHYDMSAQWGESPKFQSGSSHVYLSEGTGRTPKEQELSLHAQECLARWKRGVSSLPPTPQSLGTYSAEWEIELMVKSIPTSDAGEVDVIWMPVWKGQDMRGTRAGLLMRQRMLVPDLMRPWMVKKMRARNVRTAYRTLSSGDTTVWTLRTADGLRLRVYNVRVIDEETASSSSEAPSVQSSADSMSAESVKKKYQWQAGVISGVAFLAIAAIATVIGLVGAKQGWWRTA